MDLREPLLTKFGSFLALVLVLGIASCKNETPQQSGQRGRRPQSGPVAVKVSPAKPGHLVYTIVATGTAGPRTEVKLSARTEAQVLQVNVREGDRIEKGQLLVLLDNAVNRHQYELAKAETQGAQARLDKLLAGNRPEEIATTVAQVAEARSTLARAQAELESAKAKKTETESNAIAYARMHRQGIISPQQNLSAKTQAESATAAVAEMEAKFRENEAKVQAAQARLDLMKAGARREDVAAARSEFLRAQENANLLGVRLAETRVVAPISGIVSERRVEPGDLARVGTHLLTLVSIERLRIRTQISELDLMRIKAGQSLQVRFDALPQRTFEGRVDRVFPTVDPASRQATVEVELENPGGKIPSGLLARLTFTSQSDRQALLIPKAALVRQVQGGSYEVFVAKPGSPQAPPRADSADSKGPGRAASRDGTAPAGGGRADFKPTAGATTQGKARPKKPTPSGASIEASADNRSDRQPGRGPGARPADGAGLVAESRKVVIGESQGNWVEVLSGLSPGERVVVKGQSFLRPGSPVRIAP